MKLATAKQLSKATGADVANLPFDRGYWARIAGDEEPAEKEARDGWRTADRELRRESEQR